MAKKTYIIKDQGKGTLTSVNPDNVVEIGNTGVAGSGSPSMRFGIEGEDDGGSEGRLFNSTGYLEINHDDPINRDGSSFYQYPDSISSTVGKLKGGSGTTAHISQLILTSNLLDFHYNNDPAEEVYHQSSIRAGLDPNNTDESNIMLATSGFIKLNDSYTSVTPYDKTVDNLEDKEFLVIDNTDGKLYRYTGELGAVTASNGIVNVDGNVELGGSLNEGFTIINSDNAYLNFRGNLGLSGVVLGGDGLTTSNVGGQALVASTSSSDGSGTASFRMYHGNTFSGLPIIKIERFTSSTPSNGFGGGIEFINSYSTTQAQQTNRILSTWSDVSNRKSRMIFQGAHNSTGGSFKDMLTLNGDGDIAFNNYGSGLITGTATRALGVTSLGKVIEMELSGGGDFIPLSGTEVGSLVTGDIEFNAVGLGVSLNIKNNVNTDDNNSFSGIRFFDDGPTALYSINGLGEEQFLFTNQTGTFFVASTTPTSQGISGNRYFPDKGSETYAQMQDVWKEIIDTKIANYTLVDTDLGRTIEMNLATANTITINDTDLEDLPIHGRINLIQYGAGQTSVVATGTAVILSAGGATKLASRYSPATIIKRSATEFYLVGDITT